MKPRFVLIAETRLNVVAIGLHTHTFREGEIVREGE